jgi:hypothetical protein
MLFILCRSDLLIDLATLLSKPIYFILKAIIPVEVRRRQRASRPSPPGNTARRSRHMTRFSTASVALSRSNETGGLSQQGGQPSLRITLLLGKSR